MIVIDKVISFFIMKRILPKCLLNGAFDTGRWELDYLPSYSKNPKHAARKMTRDELQRVMDFLLKFIIQSNDHDETR